MPTTPCPVWCDGVQCQEPLAADRYHQTGWIVPVILREYNRTADGALQSAAVSGDLNIAVFTSATDPSDEVWISFDEGHRHSSITVSLESAQRLHRALGGLLGQVEEIRAC